MCKNIIGKGNKRGRGASLIPVNLIQCNGCDLITTAELTDTDLQLSSPCEFCSRFRQPRAIDHPLYQTWRGMKRRCTNPDHDCFKDYGGRGINVCERWLSDFYNFVEDMGERPEGYSLDRINNDMGYSPSNCRWADAVTQANNKRTPTTSFSKEWSDKKFGVK